ncbi:hypothetical protein BJ165DRAFT_1436716 [Panaeolus papilionaceus]|nr:hypothetical protein BJ165DRAFT_1436716 [Panaeolus papilionaceus]
MYAVLISPQFLLLRELQYCHRRPKAVANGRVYPQCGNDCRRRAEKFGVVDPLDLDGIQPVWARGRQPPVQPMFPKIFQSALSSSNIPKLPNVLDTFLSTPSTKFCVVCQRNPPYNDGLRSFPTCGRRCGEIWKSRLPSGGRSRSQSQPPRPDYNYHYQTAPATFKPRFSPKMCSVSIQPVALIHRC